MSGAAAGLRRSKAVVPDDPFDLLPDGAVVAVAMSGGVDSSVTAAECVARGVRCFGVTLAMWPRDGERDRDRGCCSIDAVEDARRVATTLGIPHYSWNLERAFHDEVVTTFATDYVAGRTPNPCVRCNQRIKFGALLERALAAGASHVATGHYARIGRRDGWATLHRSPAAGKDQAYTLHRLQQRQLLAAVFPLGGMRSKDEVRGMAAKLGLSTAAKPDSQELCFVEGTLSNDLSRRLAGRFSPGPLRHVDGRLVGRHRGIPFYTVGQRSRLGVAPDRPDAQPLHVIAIDAASNQVVVGPRIALTCDRVDLRHCRWIEAPPPLEAAVQVQLRAHGPATTCSVASVEGDRLTLRFRPAVARTAPGQAAVLYEDDEVLGGGEVVASQ